MELVKPAIGCCAAALLALAPAGVAARQESAPEQQSAAAAPARTVLGYMVGTWRIAAEDPDSGESFTICYSVAPYVGDAWLSGSGSSAELGFESKDVWGIDPRSGEVIRTIFDSSGTYAIVRSPGWQGDTLVFEGEARSSNGVTRVRETIERNGPDEFHATWEASRAGEWRAYSVERATRRNENSCEGVAERN